MSQTESDGLLRHSVLLMAANMVGSVCNLLFHVVMGHSLDKVEYGVFASMAGIVLIVATPLDAVRTAMTHFAARLVKEGRRDAVRGLVWNWYRKLMWPAVICVVLGAVFGRPVAAFFQITTVAPVVLTGFVLAGSLFVPIVVGALLGLQSFLWMSISAQAWGVVRLIAGALFVVALSATAVWGLAAQALGVCASVLLGVWGIRRVIAKSPTSRDPVAGVEEYFAQSLVILTGFAVLMNADIVLVKHYFPPELAGAFARAGTIARTVIFLPMPIALAMFPKVTSEGGVDERSRRTFLHALAYVAGLTVLAAGACALLPWLPLWILYGDRNPDASTIFLVRAVVWAMAPLSVSYLLMNFELAQHRFRAAYSLVLCAIGYVAGVAVFHDTLRQIPAVLGFMSFLSVVFLLAGLPRKGDVEPAGRAEKPVQQSVG